MSNRVSIQFCRMIDYTSDGYEIDRHWGYRIFDDYGQSYNNVFESLEELAATITRHNVLDYINENHDEFWESVYDKGIYFNGDWIPAEDLRAESAYTP